MLISFGILNISYMSASAEIKKNYDILNNDVTYNIESVTKEMFGDVQVKSSEYLYNLDGSFDYIYVTFENGGYAVYYKDTMELLEYATQGSLSYPNTNTKKYYGGPSMYLTKQNNCFVNTLTGELLDISSKSVALYSEEIRDIFTSNYECRGLQTDIDFDYSSVGVNSSNFANNFSDYSCLKLDSFNKDIDILVDTGKDIPTFDPENPIRGFWGTFVPNYNYFFGEPLHGKNKKGTCGAVAAQLLLSYNNYYNDRRIIADKYLNGGAGSASEKEKNPNLCTDPMMMNKYTLGTRGIYEDGRDNSNSYFKYLVDKFGIGATFFSLSDCLEIVLNERREELGGKIDFSVGGKAALSPPVIESNDITSEIDSGRPVIVIMLKSLGGVNHAAVAYGYQKVQYANTTTSYLGYITHCGWDSGSENIWLNSSWCNAYVSLKINHTHYYTQKGMIENVGRYELKCDICGHRLGKAPDGNLNIINVRKQGSAWRIQVENSLNIPITVYYNAKMCNLSDAKIWTGLKDIKYETLAGWSTTTLTIPENGTATSVALSYILDDVRYFTYANKLNADGSLNIMHGAKTVPSYTQNGMTVRNLGKNGSTWLIELTNNTGNDWTFDYNYKMCNAADAVEWKNLSHPATITLEKKETTPEPLEITENGTATSIAIS